MGELVYSMITSLDGCAEAAEGDLGSGAEVPEVHTFIGDLFRPVRTFLYGRRMYETMVFWETAHDLPDAPPHIVDDARDWQAADEVVHSTTLAEVSSARTRIERSFDAVARLKAESDHDLSVDGPTLAARRSPPAWWTSTTCSSPPASSAVAGGSSPTACAWTSSSSRSDPSPMACCTRATGRDDPELLTDAGGGWSAPRQAAFPVRR